jgi:hypothetical protein
MLETKALSGQLAMPEYDISNGSGADSTFHCCCSIACDCVITVLAQPAELITSS